MQQGRQLIILGVILGLVTVTMGAIALLCSGGGDLFGSLQPTPTPPPFVLEDEGIPTTQVIVALQPIPQGSEFVAGSIGRRDWPANNVPPDIIANEAETISKVAKTDIVQGQVIVRSLLTDSLSLTVAPHTQAWCDIEDSATLVYSLTTSTGPVEGFTTVRGASGAIRLQDTEEENKANLSCVRNGFGSVTVNFFGSDPTGKAAILYSCTLPLECQKGVITITAHLPTVIR